MSLHDVQEDTDNPGGYRLTSPPVKRDYVLSPFNLSDMDEIDQWVRQRALDGFLETVDAMAGLSRQDRIELVANEARRVSALTWSSKESAKYLANVNGMVRLVWQVIHKGTDLTEETLLRMMTVTENQQEAMNTVRRLNNLDAHGVSHQYPTQAQPQGQTTTAVMGT